MTGPGYEDAEHEAEVLNRETDDTWHEAFDASLRAQETAARRQGEQMPGKTCDDCTGTGKVPAGGYEPAEAVTDGYVDCTTCQGTGSVMTTAELGEALTASYDNLRTAREVMNDLAVRYAVAQAKETWPTAARLVLDTSDQSYDHGYVVTDVLDDSGESIEGWENAEPEDLWRPLSDIDWDHPAVAGDELELD